MDDTYPRPTVYEQDNVPKHEAIKLDMDLQQWNERTKDLMDQNARIIAFRGAGTVNGIEAGAASSAIDLLREYVDQITAEGTPVALMYDGDGDDRAKPDIGSIFGGLADALVS